MEIAPATDIQRLCVNAIRILAIDIIEKAKSGHPGLPLGAAPMAYVLWSRFLKHNPQDPSWPDRDRFVLSAGHGSALLYALHFLFGYGLTVRELQQFRQWESLAPGHPEFGLTPGVEATTGPLGQGVANAVGLALAERILAVRFNRGGHRVVDHRTYALVSDGDLMEGVAAEACSLAGHWGLGKLTLLYDDNGITLDGPAQLSFSEDVGQRFESYGWQVLKVANGDTDLAGIESALSAAQATADRPTLVIIKTTIGFGSPHKAGKSEAHGSPLGPQEAALTRQALGGTSADPFAVPEEVLAAFRATAQRGVVQQQEWQAKFAEFQRVDPALARQWQEAWDHRLPRDWDQGLPAWVAGDRQSTRSAGGRVLNAIAARVPALVGGDADLSVSTCTALDRSQVEGGLIGSAGPGRNIHYGVREHAMASISNGLAYHTGLRPFCATFFCFSDYMRPAIRLAALSRLPVIYVWTHDSIALGEDGPTHQPIEQLMSLRALPNFTLLRPADANETAEAWKVAMRHTGGPVGLVLTRQALPVIDRDRYAPASLVEKGAYILSEASDRKVRLILIGTGSEVALALAAQPELEASGIPTRVVSMPSWELFDRQPASYRDSVLPRGVRARVSIEAGVTFGWERYVGTDGISLGIDRFGASAPGEVLYREFGFTVEGLVEKASRLACSRPLAPLDLC